MKYRIRGTKGSFDNIDDLIDSFCKEKESCYGCVLGVHLSEGCRFWCNSHKEEVIKLLNIEIEKPLEEYTLKEIKENCENHVRKKGCCDNCFLLKYNICTKTVPCNWNIDIKRWTEEEIKSTKAILELYRDAEKIYCGEGLYCYIFSANRDKYIFSVPKRKFPSIKQGECVKISEILESENG